MCFHIPAPPLLPCYGVATSSSCFTSAHLLTFCLCYSGYMERLDHWWHCSNLATDSRWSWVSQQTEVIEPTDYSEHRLAVKIVVMLYFCIRKWHLSLHTAIFSYYKHQRKFVAKTVAAADTCSGTKGVRSSLSALSAEWKLTTLTGSLEKCPKPPGWPETNAQL